MHPDDGSVASNFIVQALNNEDITIFGAGNQSHSFCYVNDLIDGMIRLMNSRNDLTGPINNIENPNELTILKFAQKVIELMNSSSKLIFFPLPQDDPLQRQPKY